MSPLSSLTNMPPSLPSADTAGQAQDQPQDPGQARFANILRQRQGASTPAAKAAKETPATDRSVDIGDAAGKAYEPLDPAKERPIAAAPDVGTPTLALDPAQLPPLWTQAVHDLRVAMPETWATSILAERSPAEAIANPLADRPADQLIKVMDSGAGNSASRGVEAQTGHGRGMRADLNGSRLTASAVASEVEQPIAATQAGAGKGAETRPHGIAFDALPARTDALVWGSTPLKADVAAARHAGPAPVTVAVEARVGTPRFVDETAQQVTWLARNGIEHAEIRVKPAELGPISVRIEMQNNEAVISFAVTQPETRVAVEDALHRLQEMLAESGISMGETSVGGHNFGQQLRDDREAGRGRNVFAAPAQMHAAALEGIGLRAQVATRGMVDTFA